ncbi:hypothetical protein ACFLXF_03185 [Chloroflexota bacterium]
MYFIEELIKNLWEEWKNLSVRYEWENDKYILDMLEKARSEVNSNEGLSDNIESFIQWMSPKTWSRIKGAPLKITERAEGRSPLEQDIWKLLTRFGIPSVMDFNVERYMVFGECEWIIEPYITSFQQTTYQGITRIDLEIL